MTRRLEDEAMMRQLTADGKRVIRVARYNAALAQIWRTQLPNCIVSVYNPKEDEGRFR